MYMYQNKYIINKTEEGYVLEKTYNGVEFKLEEIDFLRNIEGMDFEYTVNNISEVHIKEYNGVPCLELYHVTMEDNLEAVKSFGLEPRIGELSEMLGEEVEFVYAFANEDLMGDALMGWLGEAYDELAEEKDIDEIQLHSFKLYIPLGKYFEDVVESEAAYEFLIKNNIPAEWIQYYQKEN